ncbi:unnamed protein product [Rotaria sordida]|uniref:Uncharacterized protein n=1 Tax=Rotaria sordida TaxID=392033 RepID=A0A819H4F6_9BILA|nr:unnamed protein product [Rotaria sordida]
MATDEYTTACLEKEAREYEKAIALFTKILSEQNNTTNKNYLIMVYKRRAECYYKLAKFQNVIDDINKAKQEGLDISKDPEFFYMFKTYLNKMFKRKVGRGKGHPWAAYK